MNRYKKVMRYANARIRQLDAEERTPLDQLKILDRRLGFLRGAEKERKKLLGQMDYKALDCYKNWLRNHNV